MSVDPARCSIAKPAAPAPYSRRLQPHLHDTISHQGIDYLVEGTLDYRLAGRVLRQARLTRAGAVRYLESPSSDPPDRVLWLAEIAALDITTPPPAEIYHRGDSFLLKLSGTAEVAVAGRVPGLSPGPCSLWRYRAAGGRFLQIEAWPGKVRMLEGASMNPSMLEVRPATLETHTG